jgi:DNA-binding MarR family transcriptional regulator
MKTPAPADPSTPSATDAHLGFWLRVVSNHVSGSLRKRVEARGVSVSEWVALRQILGAPQASHASLVEALGMTKGAVSKIVARLQSKGLLESVAAPGDRRCRHLALTPAGHTLVPELAALADQNDALYFSHLAPDQRDRLEAVLRDIAGIHHLKEIPVA